MAYCSRLGSGHGRLSVTECGRLRCCGICLSRSYLPFRRELVVARLRDVERMWQTQQLMLRLGCGYGAHFHRTACWPALSLNIAALTVSDSRTTSQVRVEWLRQGQPPLSTFHR